MKITGEAREVTESGAAARGAGVAAVRGEELRPAARRVLGRQPPHERQGTPDLAVTRAPRQSHATLCVLL